MKVLFYFLDMVRVSDDSGSYKGEYLNLFRALGSGKLFTEVYTEGPDTPRGMNQFFFGSSNPGIGNGLSKSYPSDVQHSKSILKALYDQGVTSKFFIPDPLDPRIFPSDSPVETTTNQEEFWGWLKEDSDEDMFLFFQDSDYHHTISDFSATRRGERLADAVARKHIETAYYLGQEANLEKLVIFSDHGFHGSFDSMLSFDPLGPHRTKILWYETDFSTDFRQDEKLYSLSEVAHSAISDSFEIKDTSPKRPGHSGPSRVVIRDDWQPPFMKLFSNSGRVIWEREISQTNAGLLHNGELSLEQATSSPTRGSKASYGYFVPAQKISATFTSPFFNGKRVDSPPLGVLMRSMYRFVALLEFSWQSVCVYIGIKGNLDNLGYRRNKTN